MSECNICGITDFEINAKQIKDYLVEIPDNDILENQTDKMFFSKDYETICRMCDLEKQ